MKKTILFALTFLLGFGAAFARPAFPAKKTIRKSDGSLMTVTLTGDERLHYYAGEDGSCWQLQADGSLVSLDANRLSKMRKNSHAIVKADTERRAVRSKRRAPLVGQKRGLVVLVNFIDNQFSMPNPQATFNDFFNKEGYNDYGMQGSVSDYFKAQSYGKFDLQFDVVGPYKLSRSMGYYGGPTEYSHDSNARDMIEEAVKAANKDVNFQNYDWDGDGKVDQVFVVYAGYGENYGANPNTVWPHESSIDYKGIVLDGMKISTYACSCELKGTQGTTLDGIGAACHEFSHCLGIMDHYDTGSGVNFGGGPWDLMCSGSYNDDSCCPAAYTAYERWVSGWLEPVEVTDETQVKDMKPLTDAPEAYVLYNEGDRNEYYLLENRQQKGFDKALCGHGLLVFHVDYSADAWTSNSINSGSIQRMAVVAADNHYNLSYSSLQGDPFPGAKNVTSLTDHTFPKATTHNANTDGEMLLHRAIEHVEESKDGLISMLLARPDLSIPVLGDPFGVTPNAFSISWDAVARAAGYELTLTEIPPKSDVKEACLLEETFKRCYKSSTGFSDISGSLNNYLDNPGFAGSKLYQTPDLLRIGTSTTAGYLRTPVQRANATGDLTVVMTVKPLKEGTAVKGNLKIVTNTAAKNLSIPFEFSTQTTLVFNPDVVLNEIYRVDIEPASGMYISYLALYDGKFTADELSVGAAKAKRRVKSQTITTTDTRCTFTDLNPACTYELIIRSYNDEQQSKWSEKSVIVLDRTPVNEVKAEDSTSTPYYDLQGRRTAAPTHGLYIHGGKKVMVK